MDKYINGSLVKRVLVFKTRKHPDIMWTITDSCFGKYIEIIGTYTEKKMISSLEKRYAFYKDGIVYQKPHIILEFSKRHDIYFDSDEEMEGWFESFMEEFGKPFIYID